MHIKIDRWELQVARAEQEIRTRMKKSKLPLEAGVYTPRVRGPIKKRGTPRPSRRFHRILVKALKGWWPSRYANFRMAQGIDVMWLVGICARGRLNVSVWEAAVHKGSIVLRVPENEGGVTKDLLLKNGLWYNRRDYVWQKRCDRKFERHQRYIENALKGHAKRRGRHAANTEGT